MDFFLRTWDIIKRFYFKLIREDELVVYSAAIAFFTVFSLPAVAVIIVTVVGMLFGEQAVKGELASQIEGVIGEESARQVEMVIQNVSTGETGSIAGIVGIATLVLSATVAFKFLQKSINAMWHIKPKPGSQILKLGFDRLLSFGVVMLLAVLLMLSFIVDVLIANLGDILYDLLPAGDYLLIQGLNYLFSLVFLFLAISMIFKYLPDAVLSWKDVWAGATLTSFSFLIGKYAISLLLSQAGVASTYGAAGALATILVWVFYSAMILLAGAAFTQVYAECCGRGIKPKKNAVKLSTKEEHG
jgi:membrane protein